MFVVLGEDGEAVIVGFDPRCRCAADMCADGQEAQTVPEFRSLLDLDANGYCTKVRASACFVSELEVG